VTWTEVKKQQAADADYLAAVASGIGEYGIANACYRLAAILRQSVEHDHGPELNCQACYYNEPSQWSDTIRS
jgi:hypothetical protein